MVEKIKFGTLYMDGQPQEVGGWYPTDEPALGLGNTVPGKEITWLKSGNIYMLSRREVTRCCQRPHRPHGHSLQGNHVS